VVAFKTADSRNWFQNEALVSLAIRSRTFPEGSGDSALKYYDGAKHQSYLYPSKASETTFCRGSPRPKACDDLRDFDPAKWSGDPVIVDHNRHARLRTPWKQLNGDNRIAKVIEKYTDQLGGAGRGSESGVNVGYDPVVDRRP
jgi:hypothetical protein